MRNVATMVRFCQFKWQKIGALKTSCADLP
jgi:hypothetical protein